MALSLFQFAQLIYNKEELTEFLIQHGILANTIKCSSCGKDVNINKETLMYRCRKRYMIKNKHKKKISKQCNFKKNAKLGTWFNNGQLDIATVCKIISCFLLLPQPREKDTQEETGTLQIIVIDWFYFCREVCVFWADKNSKKLGGPGKVVELEEAKIGRQKYNRGRFVKGEWIFAGYEHESKKIFITSVKNRTEETLLACIKEWILPGTTIVSDCWKSYNCLNNEGFQHLRVNYSYNFVDPQTSINVQHMECVWREVWGEIPTFETKSKNFEGFLAEYLFKRVYNQIERIEIFFDIIAEMYSPIVSCKDELAINTTLNSDDQKPNTSAA